MSGCLSESHLCSCFLFYSHRAHRHLHSFPTRRSSDLPQPAPGAGQVLVKVEAAGVNFVDVYQRTGLYKVALPFTLVHVRSEEHTSELQSLTNLVCRLLLEKKKQQKRRKITYKYIQYGK